MVTMIGWWSLHSADGYTSHKQSDAISDVVTIKSNADQERCVACPVLWMLKLFNVYIDDALYLSTSKCLLFSPYLIMRIETPQVVYTAAWYDCQSTSPCCYSFFFSEYLLAAGDIYRSDHNCGSVHHCDLCCYYLVVWLDANSLEKATFMDVYDHSTVISSIKRTLFRYTMATFMFGNRWLIMFYKMLKLQAQKVRLVFPYPVEIPRIFHWKTQILLVAILLNNVFENESLFLVHISCSDYHCPLVFELKVFRYLRYCYYNCIHVCVVFHR